MQDGRQPPRTEKTEAWTSSCLQSNSNKENTPETLLEKDKIRKTWQQERAVAIMPEGQIQEKYQGFNRFLEGEVKITDQKVITLREFVRF